MLPTSLRVFIAVKPIDLRMSFDRLAGIVRSEMGEDPKGGSLYVFRNKANDRCKVLFHDGTGYCVLYKRLDVGTFSSVEGEVAGATRIEFDGAKLAAFLEGIGSSRTRKKLIH
jgi:transposase